MEDITISNRNLARLETFAKQIQYNWIEYDFFLEYLHDIFKKYIDMISTLEGQVKLNLLKNKEITFCLYEKINQAIGDCFKGNTLSAYHSMQEAISCLSDILLRKSQKRHATGSEFGFKAIVIGENGLTPTREYIFHIPFEKRYLVKSNRYSIPGVPSIYLGRSIYGCYMELGKPPLENFWVSLFTFSQDVNDIPDGGHLKLMDLTISYSSHKTWLLIHHAKADEKHFAIALDQLVDDILLLPLIMSCSIACKYPKEPFQQEYIIPQIVYQLCKDRNEFVGTKYSSTKLQNINPNIYPHVMDNFALPAHDIRKAGYCPKLSSQLVLTEPITISHSFDKEIRTDKSFSSHGLPILSNIHESLHNDKVIIELDKMTIYFDDLLNSFVKDKNTELLRPLYGWHK